MSSGTKVRFGNIKDLVISDFEDIEKYLAREFAWFLELKSPFHREIRIDGNPIRYEYLVGDRDNFEFQISERTFAGRYVRWDERLNDEYSRYYFSGTDQQERAKRHTTFNNKGDSFFHSLFIESDYFDGIEIETDQGNLEDNVGQIPLWGKLENESTFKELIR